MTGRIRYARCTETCTADCGHCKGWGRNAMLLRDQLADAIPANLATAAVRRGIANAQVAAIRGGSTGGRSAEVEHVEAASPLSDDTAGAEVAATASARTDRSGDHIHTYFGLTYANYLVLHRSLMQSMPAEWQVRAVAVFAELDEAFAHIDTADTAAFECEYGDLTAARLAELGVVRSDDEPDADADVFYHDRNGTEHHGSDPIEVPLPGGDPVPHYNRGRTFVAPRLRGVS